MEEQKITEIFVGEKIKEFLVNKQNFNWYKEKYRISNLHEHGADIVMTGGSKNGEKFIIECKCNSYLKSAKSANKEGWLNTLGQIITRMNTSRTIKSGVSKGEPNRAYNMVWAFVKWLQKLHLCNDEGEIEMFTPSQFDITNKKQYMASKLYIFQ